jgi:hypothetical protein
MSTLTFLTVNIFDYAFEAAELEPLGLPSLNSSQIPTCGGTTTEPTCSRRGEL